MKVMKKIVVLCLVVALCFSLAAPAFATSTEDARGFINHLYVGMLGRNADETGIATFTYKIVSEGMGGAWVAEQLYGSSEFTKASKSLSNIDFVTRLLNALYLNPTDSDRLYFVNLLEQGYKRNQVFSLMLASANFQQVCDSYGVMMGTSASGKDGAATAAGAAEFIQHLYSGMLGRDADASAVASYSYNLVTERKSGNWVVEAIAASYEFRSKDLERNGTQYVEAMLKGLYESYTQEDVSTYTDMLTKGYTRSQVLAAMLNSAKFQNLCNKYGVLMGAASGNTSGHAQTSANRSAVEEYVARLYEKFLGREPDAEGFNNYVSKVVNRQMSLAGVAASIAGSREFAEKSMSDALFLEAVYQALLMRSVDPSGNATYTSGLKSGKSRSWVLSCICNSAEFKNLYGTSGASVGTVNPSTYTVGGTAVNREAAVAYVARLYDVFLGRSSANDLYADDYVDALVQRRYSAAGVAALIASSAEARAIGSNLSGEQFIEKCYLALLDRGSDTVGMSTYKRALINGYSRSWVFTKICASAEFQGRGEFSTMNVVPGYLNASSYIMG